MTLEKSKAFDIQNLFVVRFAQDIWSLKKNKKMRNENKTHTSVFPPRMFNITLQPFCMIELLYYDLCRHGLEGFQSWSHFRWLTALRQCKLFTEIMVYIWWQDDGEEYE